MFALWGVDSERLRELREKGGTQHLNALRSSGSPRRTPLHRFFAS